MQPVEAISVVVITQAARASPLPAAKARMDVWSHGRTRSNRKGRRHISFDKLVGQSSLSPGLYALSQNGCYDFSWSGVTDFSSESRPLKEIIFSCSQGESANFLMEEIFSLRKKGAIRVVPPQEQLLRDTYFHIPMYPTDGKFPRFAFRGDGV